MEPALNRKLTNQTPMRMFDRKPAVIRTPNAVRSLSIIEPSCMTRVASTRLTSTANRSLMMAAKNEPFFFRFSGSAGVHGDASVPFAAFEGFCFADFFAFEAVCWERCGGGSLVRDGCFLGCFSLFSASCSFRLWLLKTSISFERPVFSS